LPTGGDGWYSDAGYFLLGMVIEKASGQRYRDFMQRRIFDPAGMADTSTTDRARVLKGRVATYSLRDDVHVNWRRDWDYELPSFFGIWSTLKDLAAWDRALRRGTLLKPESLAQMTTPARLAGGHVARVYDRLYGLGWQLFDLGGHRVAGHEGASGTYLLRFLDEPLTIVLLTNLDVQSGSVIRS
jgi:D-alanyl-D-alanine carboxypeptidase